MDEHGLARGLGWVSLGVGLAAIAAPVPLMKALGLGDRPNLGRFLGVRDILLGAGILRGQNTASWVQPGASPTPWTWRLSSAARPPGPSGGTEHLSASPQARASAP